MQYESILGQSLFIFETLWTQSFFFLQNLNSFCNIFGYNILLLTTPYLCNFMLLFLFLSQKERENKKEQQTKCLESKQIEKSTGMP